RAGRACHDRAAHDGITRATMSEATPMPRNKVPAVSVAPSERAYKAFCVTPTAARASAATMRMIEAADRRDERDAITGDNATVGGGIGVTVPAGDISEIALLRSVGVEHRSIGATGVTGGTG